MTLLENTILHAQGSYAQLKRPTDERFRGKVLATFPETLDILDAVFRHDLSSFAGLRAIFTATHLTDTHVVAMPEGMLVVDGRLTDIDFTTADVDVAAQLRKAGFDRLLSYDSASSISLPSLPNLQQHPLLSAIAGEDERSVLRLGTLSKLLSYDGSRKLDFVIPNPASINGVGYRHGVLSFKRYNSSSYVIDISRLPEEQGIGLYIDPQ